MITTQGWEHLRVSKVSVNPSLVREFYENFKTEVKTTGASVVGVEEFSFTSSKLAKWLKIPTGGFHELPSEKSAKDMTAMKSTASRRLFGKSTPVTETAALTLTQRIAHQIVSRAIVLRQEKRTSLTGIDLIHMDKFIHKERIDLPKVIIQHMHKVAKGNHSLPYAGIVKTILVQDGVYNDEREETLGSELEKGSITKMQFQKGSNVPLLRCDEAGTSKQGAFGSVQHKILFELGKLNGKMDVLLDLIANQFEKKPPSIEPKETSVHEPES